MVNIFGLRLTKLHKKHKLDKVLELFKDYFNEDRFLGYGDDASAFKYNRNTVIKVCTKGTHYFGRLPKATAEDLRHSVNQLEPFLLPMLEILYEDDVVFVYTQPLCKKIDKNNITLLQFKQILLIESAMITHNISSNTTVHNLAIYQGKVVLFDYHDLSLVDSKKMGHLNHWWRNLMKHIINNISYTYAPKQRKKYRSLISKFDAQILNQFKLDNLLPEPIIELLQYIYHHKDKLTHRDILPYLQNCIKNI